MFEMSLRGDMSFSLFSLPVTSLDLLQENQTLLMDRRKVQILTVMLAVSLLGWPWSANVAGVTSLNGILGRGMSLVSTFHSIRAHRVL